MIILTLFSLKGDLLRLILCNELYDNSYRELLKSLPQIYPSLEFEDLSKAKVEVLIENKKLKLSEKNYNLLREHFKGQHLHLIETYNVMFHKVVAVIFQPYWLNEGVARRAGRQKG